MARYAIGDIQGCYKQFIRLLDVINFNYGTDELYLVGDLVNRGPESLKVLLWMYRHSDKVVNVLGNHDIYLLARYYGVTKASHDDTLSQVLNHKKVVKLIEWLKRCSLIHELPDYILVHAGIYPHIDYTTLLKLNEIFSKYLCLSDKLESGRLINKIYTNKPNAWCDDLSDGKQLRFLVNCCTRMRYLDRNDYSLNYKEKSIFVHGSKFIFNDVSPINIQNYKVSKLDYPNELVPWFLATDKFSISKKVIFGHWAALGLYANENVIGLDSGCVWGKELTALNLDTGDIYQVPNI